MAGRSRRGAPVDECDPCKTTINTSGTFPEFQRNLDNDPGCRTELLREGNNCASAITAKLTGADTKLAKLLAKLRSDAAGTQRATFPESQSASESNFRGRVEGLTAKLQTKTAQCRTCVDQQPELRAEITRLRSELNEQQLNSQSTVGKLQNAQEALQKAGSNNVVLQEKVAALENQLDQQRAVLLQREAEAQSATKQVETAQQEAQEQVQAAQAQLKQAREEAAQCAEQAQQASTQAEDMRAQLKQAREEATQCAQQAQQQAQQAQAQIEEAQQASTQAEAQLATQQQQLQQARERNKELTKQMNIDREAHENSIQDAQARNKQDVRAAEQKTQEALREAQEQHNAEMEQLREQLASTSTEQLRAADAKISDLEEMLNNLIQVVTQALGTIPDEAE